MVRTAALFRTVAEKDYLGFWADNTLKAREVADFLDLDKRDIAKVAHVAPASVRYDEHIPKEVLERLQEIANICALVAQHFEGNAVKTALWFKTKNPRLGDIAPRDMIRYGRAGKLRRFVVDAMEKNAVKLPVREPASSGLPALIEQRRAEIARLCARYRVRELALFGSILRNDFDAASSDVDAVVSFGPPKGESLARQYFDFKRELEELLAHPVDLVEIEAMPDTRLRRIIERTKVPIYAEAA
jgi:predicted nucleotidyltransferase